MGVIIETKSNIMIDLAINYQNRPHNKSEFKIGQCKRT